MNMIQVTMKNIAFWIRLSCLIGYVVVAVPFEYDLDDWDRELSYDFDTEQSEVRYDPKLLSEELEDTLTKRRGASCNISNIIYKHGEQVARNDPCEVCVCMDGETFCYWRECSGEISDNLNYGGDSKEELEELEVDDSDAYSPYWKLKRPSSSSRHIKKHFTSVKPAKVKKVWKSTRNPWVTKPTLPSTTLPKPTKNTKSKKLHKLKKLSKRPRKPARKRMKSKKVFSFPEHLPATLHFDIENAERSEYYGDSGELKDKSLENSKTKDEPHLNSETFTSTTSNENILLNKNQPQQGANNSHLTQFQASERNISQNDFDTKGWQGFSLNTSNSTTTLSSSSSLPSFSPSSTARMSTTTMSTTTSRTTFSASTASELSNSNSNGGSSGTLSKHINFQSGGIIPNDVSIDSEDDSDDNDIDSSFHGEGSTGDKKTDAEKMGSNDSGPENRRIQFVDVPMAKHYIITSSGSVENADVLASENVLSQFRNDFGEVDSETTGNAVVPPSPPEALSAPMLPQSVTNAGGNASETALQEKTSAAIISNDAGNPLSLLEPSSSASAATMSSASRTEVRIPSLEGTAIGSTTAEAATAVQSNAMPSSTYAAGGEVSSDASISAALQQPAISSSSLDASSEPGQQGGVPSFLRPEPSSTEQPPGQQQPPHECVVMGTSYKVGTILPQDTGNCLQCVCAEGSNSEDSPRVTCSPHNCPPLVLPDLFDTTGY